jgi:hypothetical protein
VPAVTVIEFVPAPVIIDHPDGTAQVYVVALGTTAMLYTNPVIVGHTVAVPEITRGVTGVAGLTVTASVLAELVPQLFVAATLIFPF